MAGVEAKSENQNLTDTRCFKFDALYTKGHQSQALPSDMSKPEIATQFFEL